MGTKEPLAKYISKNVSSPKIEWRHVSSDNLGRINIVYIPLQVPTQWILWPKTNEQVPFERTICSPTDSGRLILQNTKWNPIQSRNEFLTNQLIFLSVKEKKAKKAICLTAATFLRDTTFFSDPLQDFTYR